MHLQRKILPSIMCVDLANIPKTIKYFEENGIEYLHMDVMDGEFVPNLQLGTDFIKQFRSMSKIPLDIHLMITRPEDKLDWFSFQEGEYVSVHYEATNHAQRALARIKSYGAKPMIALNPATPLCVLEHIIDECDAVLLMTVNPGFAGQALIESTLQKITSLRKWLDDTGRGHIEIEVDGNVSFENGEKMSKAGANLFIAGSSSVFHKDFTLPEGIAQLRKSVAI